MKYGDTLRQRSIPEWGHYNIDYDYLKDLIKHQTTAGTNKAVSIPGQGESTERAFSGTFFKVLEAQHDRINLFVRSKSGEIERRLDHIGKSLEVLRLKRGAAPGSRLPARVVEKYAKFDADVARTGEEIRSLSRFQVAQRTGFTKILKKYRRWTKDKELSHVFKAEISNRPDSLFQLDLSYLLDQYIDILGDLRSVFDAESAPANDTEYTNAQSSAACLNRALERADDLDFDVALTTIPFGSKGAKATYWIHPDHIVEVQVLLLQYMRLYTGNSGRMSRRGSAQATPRRRQSSPANIDKYFGNEDEVGLVVLDYPEAFAVRQNASTIGSSEEARGSFGTKAAGNVRCVASGKAAVIVCEQNGQGQVAAEVQATKLERKVLQAYLDTSGQRPSLQRSNSQKSQFGATSEEDFVAVRKWLEEHQSIKPIAGAVSKRIRFTGLHNSSSGGVWASLDRDVLLKASLHEDLNSEDWTLLAQSQSTKFPHAILEIRREGHQATSLIQTLDKSHLVERVRGFSLEAHAVWTCCKPSTMASPFWISLLDRDIRKLPENVKRISRKQRSVTATSQTQNSPPQTSTSNTSYDGQSSPLASRNGDSSMTSAQEFVDPPSLQAFRKKSRKPFSNYPPPLVTAEPESEQRYWNEYDNPEDEEAGYYIYVDPNASIKFPGQELMETLISRIRQVFGLSDKAELDSLSSTDDSETDDDELAPMAGAANYGTISSSCKPSSRDGYFSSLFRSFHEPRHEADRLHERRSLLNELETRQHKTEMTKLRFYSTCLASAIFIDVILGLMTVTSRKKERGVVDAVVLFGTIVTLVLCCFATISMKTRKERLGWLHQGAVLSIAAAIVALDVLLLLWIMRI
ncbi:hypothetical protein ACN47E_004760 [Coniothyrium glycines]